MLRLFGIKIYGFYILALHIWTSTSVSNTISKFQAYTYTNSGSSKQKLRENYSNKHDHSQR